MYKDPKNCSTVLDFQNKCLKIGQKVKKWSNFARKKSQKLSVTQNGQDELFSSGQIRDQHVI